MKREGIIVGGGASGLVAAIAAAEGGASVTIVERMPRVGKKILSTGNGKCNMTNYHMTAECYRCGEPGFPMQVIGQFPVEETLRFFRRLGVLTTHRDGYVYPLSGQAQTVLDALRGKADSLGIRTVCDCHVSKIRKTHQERFVVETTAGSYEGDFVILAAGSMAAPSTGSDGSGYVLAKDLGHTVRKPLPALVQLKCKEDWFKAVAGVRTDAKVSLYASGKNGERKTFLASDTGELQLTDYGISGIPVFQVSRYAAEALSRKKQVFAVLDLMPEYSREELLHILKEQRSYLHDRSCGECLNGIFNKKLSLVLLKAISMKAEQTAAELSDRKLEMLCEAVKSCSVEVTDTNSYDKAQICMGGVCVNEVDADTMESRLVSGLYLAGEILDVDGICGGYNLQWAWSGGYVAGCSAAKDKQECGNSQIFRTNGNFPTFRTDEKPGHDRRREGKKSNSGHREKEDRHTGQKKRENPQVSRQEIRGTNRKKRIR